MENYQGEIFHLYMIQNKTLSDVITFLKDNHELDVS